MYPSDKTAQNKINLPDTQGHFLANAPALGETKGCNVKNLIRNYDPYLKYRNVTLFLSPINVINIPKNKRFAPVIRQNMFT